MATASKKQDPETLTLRERPRPVTRLNRNALMIAGGGAALFVFGAMSLALKPPRALDEEEREELYNVETKPTAEGLDALPKTEDIRRYEASYRRARARRSRARIFERRTIARSEQR